MDITLRTTGHSPSATTVRGKSLARNIRARPNGAIPQTAASAIKARTPILSNLRAVTAPGQVFE